MTSDPFSFSLGDTRITAFCDGVLGVPVATLYRLGSEHPTPELFSDAPSELFVNAFLVEIGSRRIMIDAGSGSLFGPDHGKTKGFLGVLGCAAHDITDIILTHIHPDHTGGLISDGTPAFTNATLHIGRTEAEFWLGEGVFYAPGAGDKLKGQIATAHATIDAYSTQDRVSLFDDNGLVMPDFSSRLRAGHTPGHVSIRFDAGQNSIVFVGDIVHGDKVQFRNPSVTITYDYDQASASIARAHAFEQAADEGHLIAASHLPFPGLGYVRREVDHYRFEAFRTGS
ncbi:MBL fold metallo-hydrolase [Rhizobium sp. P28RR-XV]|uniref:MBL fold metallo-hydrolase n=1 Tax=Rhizobium sp. P28RR-XV TaxID=2726737 RepID=UPI00145694C5|nr:MBL fold metallo-hydrolase [Rhizobium sp. P28RR-XV]NLR88380.1 MBL fold metallo-hydrolase [Rhizobium sp. P28RR-XV]